MAAALLISGLALLAQATAPPAGAAAANEMMITTRLELGRSFSTDWYHTTGPDVSISEDGRSIGWTAHSSGTDTWNEDGGKYFVADHTADEESDLLKELYAPGRPTQLGGPAMLSADGLSFVAPYRIEYTDTLGPECGRNPADPDEGPQYWYQQILRWERPTRSASFGDPELVTDSTEPMVGPCDPDSVPSEPTIDDPPPIMGRGANDSSWHPSVSGDGESVAFASTATDLAAGPPATPGVSALYVWDDPGTLTMVTPPGLDADVLDPTISAEGDHIVFATAATDVLPGSPPSVGGTHVYVAERTNSTPAWNIELASVSSGGNPAALDGNPTVSERPTISGDGSVVAFLTQADNLDITTEPNSASSPALVVRDRDEPRTRVVVNGLEDLTAHHIGSLGAYSYGSPTLSVDGERLVAWGTSTAPTSERQLLVFDVSRTIASASANRRSARLKRTPYDINADRGARPVVGDLGDSYVVAFSSERSPTEESLGWLGSIYLHTDGLGPDISRPWHGDPVDVSTGNFRHDETDLAAPAGAGPASVSRSYTSFGSATGVFGQGWMSPFDARVETDETGEGTEVTLLRASGQRTRFDPVGGDEWAPQSGERMRLVAQTSNGWDLVEPDGTVTHFDGDGRWTGTDAPGQPSVTMTWDGPAPDTLTSDTGYEVTFVDDTAYYYGDPYAGSDGLVDAVVSNDGRRVAYTYSDRTVLETASRPHAIGQAAGTYGIRTYEMDGPLLTRIVDQVDDTRTRVIVENTYDEWGRVKEQTTDTGDVTFFAYETKPNPPAGWIDAAGFTTVTDSASGDVTVYEYNDLGEVVAITDAMGNSVGRAWVGDRPVASTSRSEVDTDYFYDDAGRLVEVTETVGVETRTVQELTYWVPDTDPAALSDSRLETATDASGVTTAFSYTGSSQQPDEVATPCDTASADPARPCPVSGLATTSYTYHSGGLEGLVASVTDPDGVVTEYTYHADRTVHEVTTFDGATEMVTETVRDRVGDVSWDVTNPLAVERVTTTSPSQTGEVTPSAQVDLYDAEGRIIESRSPLYDGATHLASTYEYGFDGELMSSTDPSGATTIRTVGRPGDPGWSEAPGIAEVRTVTDPDGVAKVTKTDRSGDVVVEQVGDPGVPGSLATTTHTYGELGRRLTTTRPDGVVTTYRYDVEGRQVEETTGPDGDDPDHTVVTDYDEWGNVERTTTPLGDDPGATAVASVTETYFDTAGRVIAEVEGGGGPSGDQLMTGYVYDEAGRLWRTIEHLDGDLDPEDFDQISTADRVTETRYTPGGRTAQKLAPPANATTFDWSGADNTKSITTYGYDLAGRQTIVTGPDGLDTVTTYDLDGRPETVTSPAGLVTENVYDPAGQMVSTITPSGLDGPGDPATVQVDRTYTPTGQRATETDPYAPGVDLDPATRTFDYTPGGRLEEATDANGVTVTYDFDARGNRTARHSVDEDFDPIVESWDYDLADRVVAHRRPYDPGAGVGSATTYVYDPDFGWLDTVTDPTGRVATFGRYNDGQPRTETHTKTGLDTITTDWWRDGRGRTVTRDDTIAATTTSTDWAYTRDGSMVSADNPGVRDIGYGWNLDGTTATVTHSDGSQRRYTRDVMGRVTDVAVAPTPSGIGVPLATLTYDDDGRQTGETVHAANGSARGWTYDDAGRLDGYLQHWWDGTTWDTTGAVLTHRTDGRIASQTRYPGGAEAYTYDDSGQLTDVSGTTNPSSVTYGPRGNPTAATVPDAVDYTYNPNGSLAEASSVDGTATLTYDAAGRRTDVEVRDPLDAVVHTQAIAYDAAGRVTTTSDAPTGGTTTTTTRGWDGDDLLTEVTINNGYPADPAFSYVWDTTGGLPTVLDGYLWDVLETRFDHANSYLGLQIDTGTGTVDQWYGYDALGNAVDPNDNPNLLDTPDSYDPWGNPTPRTTTSITDLFRHQQRVGDLTHLRARDYHGETRQFLTPDPLDGIDGTPTVANPYHYTDNDPLNKTDPTGLRPEDGDLTSGGSPSIFEFSIPAEVSARFADVERVDIAGFIPERVSKLGPAGLYYGDARVFSSQAEIMRTQSRFYARLDFQRSRGLIRVRPTHAVGGEVFDAFPIRFNERSPEDIVVDPIRRESFFTFGESGDEIRLYWSVVHGDSRTSADLRRPSFDGQVTINRFLDRIWAVQYTGDCFPSVEVYSTRITGERDTWITAASGDPIRGMALAPDCTVNSYAR